MEEILIGGNVDPDLLFFSLKIMQESWEGEGERAKLQGQQ
jgi:hypothetical protein